MDTNMVQTPQTEEPKKRRGGMAWGFIVLAVGIIFLLQNYYPALSNKIIMPVIIIIVGLGIIFRQ